MFVGIDLGTSSVKVVVVDEQQRVVAQQSAPLEVHRPHPQWSEQDPEAWWLAACQASAALRQRCPEAWSQVRAIGLTGQMHGAVLLDGDARVLRPAILWNDGRSAAQCRLLERRAPASRKITGNLAMPGFTAPKLMWVAEHEPEVFARVARVLLPKDYLRFRLSGEYLSDPSDSAGTLWLDVARRAWSPTMLSATGMSETAMPRLVEGSQVSAVVSAAAARDLGLREHVLIAGGAGDNAAGAVGVGVIHAGQAFVSLGTSGVYFVACDRFAPNPERAVHTFCHCLPGRWHQMAVILSAASCLSWVTQLTGARDEATLLAEIEGAPRDGELLFLPYLSGERTPYNDANARGVFFGLNHDVGRAQLGRAVLEGVAFALADGQDALLETGVAIETVSVIGGGARSRLWAEILAAALARPLHYRSGGDVGPAFGAARLARLALTGEDPSDVCVAPPIEFVCAPNRELQQQLNESQMKYRRLYRELRAMFAETATCEAGSSS